MAVTQDGNMALRREVQSRRDHRFVAVVAATCTLLGVGVGFGLSQLEMPGCQRGPAVRHAVWQPIAVQRPVAPPTSWLGLIITTDDDGDGVKVERVMPGTPAARAGISPRDAVIAIDGELLESPGELVREVRQRRPGQAVELVIEGHGGASRNVTATLQPMPDGLDPGPRHRVHRSY